MTAFGLAEIATGLAHSFFVISTAEGTTSAYAGSAVGVLYAVAGLLILSMKGSDLLARLKWVGVGMG